MPFFEYSQNNSGGNFDYDEERGISHGVIVEADDAKEADFRAERIGLYFDGEGDCPCCGDRWYAADAGDSTPMWYGDPVTKLDEPNYFGGFNIKWIDGFELFVHYKDGTVKGHGFSKKNIKNTTKNF